MAVAIYAVRGPDHKHLIKWTPSMMAYFLLAALAAYRGLFDMLSRPFHWEKTQHGIFRGADDAGLPEVADPLTLQNPLPPWRRALFTRPRRRA